MKRVEIGPWKDQTVWWVGNNDGLFIMLDDVNIAERTARNSARPDVGATSTRLGNQRHACHV